MNDGDIPAERYDFSGFTSFEGNFDVISYMKYGVYNTIFELIKQIKDEEFSIERLRNVFYNEFLRIQIPF